MTPTHEEQLRPPAIATPAPTVAEPLQRAPVRQVAEGVSAGGIQALHAPVKAEPKEVRAALRYIERSATTGLVELEASTPATRNGIVAKIALEVSHASEALVELLDGLSPDKRPDLRAPANAAAEALNRVYGWISSRAPNAEMITTFDAAVHELAPALRTMNVESIGARGQQHVTNSEARESTREHADVNAAAANLKDAIDAEKDLLLAGFDSFSKLAQLDDSSPPSFIEAVAKSLLLAATGHLFGEAMGAFMQRVTRTGKALSQVAHERFVNVSTDTFQGFGSALDEAHELAEKEKVAKARIYFETGLKQAAILDAKQRKKAINQLVKSQRASADVLDSERERIAADDSVRAETYSRNAAHLWSLYQAQSTLGTHPGVTDGAGHGISRMDDYFGVRNEAGDREVGTGHQGTHGVARISVDLSSGTSNVQAMNFEITGSNHQIASKVAARGGNQFDQIELPKEVTVYLRHYRAVIAIDEKNRVRDSIGWDDIARASGHDHDLESPQAFWAVVRTSKVGA